MRDKETRLANAGKYRPLFERIYDGKAAFIEAIAGQCLDCVGFDRKAVETCGCQFCPLWHHRPFKPGVEPTGVEPTI